MTQEMFPDMIVQLAPVSALRLIKCYNEANLLTEMSVYLKWKDIYTADELSQALRTFEKEASQSNRFKSVEPETKPS